MAPPTTFAQAPLRFTDVTAEAGIRFVHTIGDAAMTNIVESTGVGCAFLDYDGDGWLDVYLVNGVYRNDISDPNTPDKETLKQATDRLYRNRGDGTFEDVTIQAGILPGGYGMGVAAADYDNDGDCDIYVSCCGQNRLYRNRGDRTFEEVAADAGVADELFSVGVIFLDCDGDVDLDLYVANYIEFDPTEQGFDSPDGFPGPMAYQGQANQLYRNDGNGRFTNITIGSGLDQPPARTMGVGAFDYDDDGRPDIFAANDAMENRFYHNLGEGRFEEVALLAGVAYSTSGVSTGAMGIEVGDVNGNGRLDFFVPDFTRTSLYENLGGGAFEDTARRAGISAACDPYISWGSVLADFDLDADLDLFIANGDANKLEGHPDLLLTNDGTGRFTDVSKSAGPSFAAHRVGRGVAAGDFDNDGDVDLLVANLNDRPVLLRNDTGRDNTHWLELKLVGRPGSSNRDAIGARIRCTVPSPDGTVRVLVRELRNGGSYLSNHDQRVHLGLGTARHVSEIEIRWPGGFVQKITNAKTDQVLRIEQPAASKFGAGSVGVCVDPRGRSGEPPGHGEFGDSRHVPLANTTIEAKRGCLVPTARP